MSTNKMKLKIGDSVRVRDGFHDEDTDHEMGGWQGRIQEIYQDNGVAMVHFDSVTIQNMPSTYIEACEEEGCGWTEYGFGFEDLETATPRDKPNDAKVVAENIGENYRYAHFGEEGREMDKVLMGVDSDDKMGIFHAWESYLSKNLTFPFVAEVSELLTRSRLKIGSKVKVRGLSTVDDQYGVIVRLQIGRDITHHPLCDLAVVNTSSPNHDPVQLYVFWYANQ